VLRDYGEERFARQIARAVVKARETAPFTSSGRLVELLYDVIPAPARRTGGHPAKRTFQALRMEVNQELAVLSRALPAAIDAIAVGGRVVVESYHSLEDRLVKRAFADAVATDVPDDLPFVPAGHEPACRLVTRGAERADAGEIDHNPRAASVRLRAIERLTPSPVRGVA
jgi:16S rRNA (cytosine1402-N4)-methyltransferase